MLLFRRPDAVLAERVPLVRRFMPFLMRRRNESLVWFEQDITVGPALAFTAFFSRAHDLRLSFFQLVLRSIARVLDEFPRLNRYVVVGGSISGPYVAISFSGKEAFESDSPRTASTARARG
jgi:hypothetical protein